MKTLKKTLCLVLAVVMVVGVLILPASATDYADDAEIEHKEAVEVLTGLGIITGTANGFEPDGTLTRAAGAAIISRLAQTPSGAEDYRSSTGVFSDVPSGYWGMNEIAYCVNYDIVGGKGDGTFDPEGELTGLEFAKMLLVAMGFDPVENGFVGAGWNTNIDKTARKVGLNDGIKAFNFSAPIARDEAAQLAFNALNYTENGGLTGRYIMHKMGAGGKGTDALDGMVFESRTEAILVANAVDDTAKLDTDYTLIPETSNAGSLADTLYDGLDDEPDYDEFGRPITVWMDDYGNVVAEIPSSPLLEYKTSVTSGKLYSDLRCRKETGVTLTVDGKADASSLNTNRMTSGNTDAIGGNGALVQVYAGSSAAKPYDIVVVNTYVAKVAGHTAAKPNADGQITAGNEEKITVALLNTSDSSLGTGGADLTATYITDDFTDDDVRNGTIVLITAAYSTTDSKYLIQTAVPAEKVTAKVSKIVTGVSVTANNVNYLYSTKYFTASGAPAVGKDADIYVDSYGNAIYVAPAAGAAAPAAQFAYLLTHGKDDGIFDNEDTFYAKLLMNDGNVVTVKTNKEYTNDGNFVAYTVKDDIYTLNETASGYTLEKTAADTNLSVKRGNTAIKIGSSDLTANSATVFLVATKSGANTVYTPYVGIENVPTLTKGASGHVTAVVYNSAKIATVVYVDATADVTVGEANSSASVAYIVGNQNAPEVSDEKGTYKTFVAFFEGEVTTLDIEVSTGLADGELSGLASGTDVVVKNVVKNGRGLVTGADSQSTTDKTGVVAAKDGVVGFGASVDSATYLAWTDDCAVYLISGGQITATTVEQLQTDWNDTVKYIAVAGTNTAEDGKAAYIFVKVVDGIGTAKSSDKSIASTIVNSITVDNKSASTGLVGTSCTATVSSDLSTKTITVSVVNSDSTNKKFKDNSTIKVKVKANDTAAKISLSDSYTDNNGVELTFTYSNSESKWKCEGTTVYVQAEDGTKTTYINFVLNLSGAEYEA